MLGRAHAVLQRARKSGFVFKIAASPHDAQVCTQHLSLHSGLQTLALFRGQGGMETGRAAETPWPRAGIQAGEQGSGPVSHSLEGPSGRVPQTQTPHTGGHFLPFAPGLHPTSFLRQVIWLTCSNPREGVLSVTARAGEPPNLEKICVR